MMKVFIATKGFPSATGVYLLLIFLPGENDVVV